MVLLSLVCQNLEKAEYIYPINDYSHTKKTKFVAMPVSNCPLSHWCIQLFQKMLSQLIVDTGTERNFGYSHNE